LVRHYGVSGVLCTATQPALQGRIGSQHAEFQGLRDVREIMADPADLACRLRRVDLRLQAPDLQAVTWEGLAKELTQYQQVLCIVNTRKDCRELHAQMPAGTTHLSALMCAQHRSEVIAEMKTRLKAGQPLRVVSTQLVEAGVDLDFPVVYRALAGLDSIAQAAGRCNREGRLLEQGRRGEVVLFAPPKAAPPGLLRKGEEAGREMLRRWPEAATRLDPEAFQNYFKLFYARVNSFDEKRIEDLLVTGAAVGQFQFRSAAEAFRLIDDTAQVAVVVHYGPHRGLVHRRVDEIRHAGPSRDRLRALQRFTVSVPELVFRSLRGQGDIEDVAGLWIQVADDLYDSILGLCADRLRWNPEMFIQ
jgi:CRISPR-associated endonuclease/helicase Cas3